MKEANSIPKEAKVQPAEAAESPSMPEGKMRNMLIFGSVGLFAAIIFGLLYLFVIAPSVPEGGQGWSIGWFLFSFAAGLTMIVLPCTLPLAFVIVPLSMGKGLIKGLSMAVAFGVGVAFTLSLYGIAAALVGGLAIDALGADLEVLKNWVYFIAGIFALIFALSGIGLLRMHMPTYSGAAPAFIQKRQEVLKAFLLGIFLGNIGVGCPHPATPLILIEIATSGDVLYGWLMFLVHAIGRVLPLLLLAFLAILGVNGLNWLLSRKAAVERATGWAMVFVAGFILTLGLFSHDWWVNSGLHSGLEAITQEAFFNQLLNETLDQNVAHLHGLEEGKGLFGLPLEWGSWVLVALWLVPIWWWWMRKRNTMYKSPAFALKKIEQEIDRLEKERRQTESLAGLDALDPSFDLKAHEAQMDELEKARRAAEERMQYGEIGVYKNPLARAYEVTLLHMHRNYLIVISIFLALTFIYFIPQNFYLKSIGGIGHDDPASDDHHSGVDTASMSQFGSSFTTDTRGLPAALPTETVELQDGDSYDITAYYVQKEVGNRTLRMLSYNGSVPGPIIKVDEGAEITINFTNNTDIEQTIHSHGIRIDNNSDGVPGQTQDALAPGETFAYTVKFEDGGVYWYHPHTRDDYGQELGLYGNYLVEPESGYSSQVNREVPLVIDDILIENDKIAEFYKEITNFALLGRFGNEFLVNGEKNYTLTAQTGEVVRFFVTNVSNARTYNLSIPGTEMKIVGADVGQYEREFFADDFLISPAERVIAEVYFDKPGTYSIMHTAPDGDVELARVLVTADAVGTSHAENFRTLKTNREALNDFADFRSYQTSQPDKRLLLTVELEETIDHGAHAHGDQSTEGVDHGGHAHSGAVGDRLMSLQWDDPGQSDRTNTSRTVNWKLVDQDTGMENMEIPLSDWTFKQGDLVKVRLTNDANAEHVMQHPIHFHGQRFAVLNENGIPNENFVWKDTVLVFPGEAIDILVEMSNLGEWMNHCHISEHLHAGMMMEFRVEDENGYATGDEYRRAAPPVMQAVEIDQQPASIPNSDTQSEQLVNRFQFDTEVPQTQIQVYAAQTKFQAQRQQQITLSFFDQAGNSLMSSSQHERPLVVTFIKSDNSKETVTYPGNTAFDNYIPPHGGTGHDNSDGHHAVPAGGMPASDGHNHIHMNPFGASFALIHRAHAHGGADDGHPDATGQVFTYTMPVVFPEGGFYRAFVEFVPDGASRPVVLTFDVEASEGFSIDNFGWGSSAKWWTLLIISLLLMSILSYGVYRYVLVKA